MLCCIAAAIPLGYLKQPFAAALFFTIFFCALSCRVEQIWRNQALNDRHCIRQLLPNRKCRCHFKYQVERVCAHVPDVCIFACIFTARQTYSCIQKVLQLMKIKLKIRWSNLTAQGSGAYEKTPATNGQLSTWSTRVKNICKKKKKYIVRRKA